MLHDVDEMRVYCGPAALIAVTGKRLPEVRAAINKAKGRPDNTGVCGMFNSELVEAMKILGLKYHREESFPAHVRTLSKLVNDKLWCLPDRKYIINVTGHYVAVENGIVVDNHTRFGCHVDEHWCSRKKVHAMFLVKE